MSSKETIPLRDTVQYYFLYIDAHTCHVIIAKLDVISIELIVAWLPVFRWKVSHYDRTDCRPWRQSINH